MCTSMRVFNELAEVVDERKVIVGESEALRSKLSIPTLLSSLTYFCNSSIMILPTELISVSSDFFLVREIHFSRRPT